MSKRRKPKHPRAGSRPWSTKEHLKDPVVLAAYDALKGEFDVIHASYEAIAVQSMIAGMAQFRADEAAAAPKPKPKRKAKRK